MKKTTKILLIGAGNRGNRFVQRTQDFDVKITIEAISDPIKERIDAIKERYDIDPKNIFQTGEEALNSGIRFDAVYIATPDKTHLDLALLALKKGFNVLLEKPMATSAEECIAITKAQEESGKVLSICHVLRYAPFFQEIKSIINSEELGKIKSINLTEKVGYWHFAHSYVRGNWRKEEESSPVILAKSCHDLDILCWLIDDEPTTVFSEGSLEYFIEEKAPKNSTDRCIECPIRDCVHDARKLYLNHEKIDFPHSTISIEDQTEKGRAKAIETGPYGRCVWKCDNDVCDIQDVIIKFKNGVQANFALRSEGDQPTREISIFLEKGEITGDLFKGEITKTKYSGRRGEAEVENIKINLGGGHGGGDPLLFHDFVDAVVHNKSKNNLTSAQKSLQSHLIAFAAEKSRKSKEKMNFSEYKKELEKEQ